MNKNDMEQLILSDKDDKENCRFQSKTGMRGKPCAFLLVWLECVYMRLCVCMCVSVSMSMYSVTVVRIIGLYLWSLRMFASYENAR